MARIRVDADQLRQYVNSLNGRINEYEGLIARMDALSQNIQASWSGDAKNAFAGMMSQYMARAQELEKILTQYRSYARDTADKFENLDAECASRIRNSF